MRGVKKLTSFWEYAPGLNSCDHSLQQVAANALCSVLAPDVQFLHAKLYSEQKDFSINRVTLSASASGRGEEICAGSRDFQFTARFKLHEDAVALSEARSFVKVFGEPPNTNEYVVRGWTFTDVNMSAKTGNIVVTLFRRPPFPDPEVTHQTIVITVAGDYGFGGFSSPGNVKITCP